MDEETLAKALADHFNPPHWENRLKNHAAKLPWDERYEDVWVERGPDDQTYTVETMEDGDRSIRALTFREIAAAVLEIQENETQPYEVTLERTPLRVTRYRMKLVEEEEK